MHRAVALALQRYGVTVVTVRGCGGRRVEQWPCRCSLQLGSRTDGHMSRCYTCPLHLLLHTPLHLPLHLLLQRLMASRLHPPLPTSSSRLLCIPAAV